MTLERIRTPSSTTAAAVSSQGVSGARTFTAGTLPRLLRDGGGLDGLSVELGLLGEKFDALDHIERAVKLCVGNFLHLLRTLVRWQVRTNTLFQQLPLVFL